MTLCLYCGAILVFNENLELIPFSDEEIEKLPLDEQADLIQSRFRVQEMREAIDRREKGR